MNTVAEYYKAVSEFAVGNYETIAFFVLGGLGLLGWWGMIRWDRRNAWWMRAAAVLCFFGLTGAGRWLPDLTRIERERTERSQALSAEALPSQVERTAAEGIAAMPSRAGAERLADDRARSARYEAVLAEIGPPPVPDAVPVVGYVTDAGVAYASYWRMPPNADKADNLK